MEVSGSGRKAIVMAEIEYVDERSWYQLCMARKDNSVIDGEAQTPLCYRIPRQTPRYVKRTRRLCKL